MQYIFCLLLTFSNFSTKERRVFVCESTTSYAYHYFKAERCEGLANCRAKITETSLDSALNVFEKQKLCGFCKNIE